MLQARSCRAEGADAAGSLGTGVSAAAGAAAVTADAGVQTEGVLLLPTALRAHGARVQQQLSQRNITEHNTAHVRPHDAINAYARGSLAGAARGAVQRAT